MPMTEREYDLINNEGGEGYNPIRAAREQREFEAKQAAASAYALTPEGRIEALQRRIFLECGSIAREWGSVAVDALQHSLYAEIQAIKAEIQAAFLAAWPLALTQARREEWNARVRAGEFQVGARIHPAKIYQAELDQGWRIADLKKAVEHYKAAGELA